MPVIIRQRARAILPATVAPPQPQEFAGHAIVTPQLAAEGAHIAAGSYGPCAGCSYPIGRGERAARLVDGTGRWCHTGCCGLLPAACWVNG